MNDCLVPYSTYKFVGNIIADVCKSCKKPLNKLINNGLGIYFSPLPPNIYGRGGVEGGKSIILLNRKCWKHLSRRDKVELIAHETCHIITEKYHGDRVAGHGRIWANYMKMAGLYPSPVIYSDKECQYSIVLGGGKCEGKVMVVDICKDWSEKNKKKMARIMGRMANDGMPMCARHHTRHKCITSLLKNGAPIKIEDFSLPQLKKEINRRGLKI